jgi:hypothetical protein
MKKTRALPPGSCFGYSVYILIVVEIPHVYDFLKPVMSVYGGFLGSTRRKLEEKG